MRTIYALVACAVAFGATVGCGDDTSSGAGGSGGSSTTTGGTSNTGGTTVNTGGTTSNSMGGMAPNCDGLLGTDPCPACAEANCCVELTACLDDAECNDCLSNPNADPMVCGANAALIGVNDCAGTACATECAPQGGTCAHFCCNDGDCGTGTCDLAALGGTVGICVDAMMAPACDAPAMSPSNGSCSDGMPCNPVTNAGCDAAAGEACDFNGMGFECFPAPNDVATCGDCGGNNNFCMPGNTCI